MWKYRLLLVTVDSACNVNIIGHKRCCDNKRCCDSMSWWRVGFHMKLFLGINLPNSKRKALMMMMLMMMLMPIDHVPLLRWWWERGNRGGNALPFRWAIVNNIIQNSRRIEQAAGSIARAADLFSQFLSKGYQWWWQKRRNGLKWFRQSTRFLTSCCVRCCERWRKHCKMEYIVIIINASRM